jgi:hypothetical protein
MNFRYYQNLFEDNNVPGDSYDIKTDNLVCPCCGKKLNLIDSTKQEYTNDDIIKVNESMLNENKLADYLLTIIEDEAKSIFEDELETEEPETDSMGNIVNDYGERFLYVNKELKKIVKMKANAIANMVKHKGIEVSPYYIENELFQALRLYGLNCQNIT